MEFDLPTTGSSISFLSATPDRTVDVEKKEERDTLRLLASIVDCSQLISRLFVQEDLNVKGRDLVFTSLGGLDHS